MDSCSSCGTNSLFFLKGNYFSHLHDQKEKSWILQRFSTLEVLEIKNIYDLSKNLNDILIQRISSDIFILDKKLFPIFVRGDQRVDNLFSL